MQPITDEKTLLEAVIKKLENSSLTDTTLADATGISRSMISAVRTKDRNPSWKNLQILARFFSISYKIEN